MPSTAQQLLEAHLAGDKARAAEIVAGLTDAALLADLSASTTPTDLVRAGFSAADATTPAGVQRRATLVKYACDLMDAGRVFSARQAKACVAFLAGDLDSLPLRSVADVTMAILGSHRASVRIEAEAKSHELLPKCLALLACADSVSYADDSGLHTARYADFQDLVVHRLCEPRWPHSALLPMMNTLRELPLTEAQLRVVVRKALAGAPELELQALPALVYQLLLLAGRGCKLEVLSGLTGHFEALELRTRRAAAAGACGHGAEEEGDEKTSRDAIDVDDADLAEGQVLLGSQICRADDAAADRETLAAVQNTVILNVDLALRQDHGLGSTLLRMLKTHALQLSSFSLSLLLLLARQPRFEDEAIAWLTGAVRGAYNEAAWAYTSPWLERALRPLRACRVAPLLLRLTRPTSPEHLLPSVVLLATAWMDATGAFGGARSGKAAGADGIGVAPADAAPTGGALAPTAEDDARTHAMSSSARLAQLGASVLVEAFRGHSGAHGEILELVLARVAARAPSVGRWVHLLARLVRAVPTLLMDHVQRLRETLAYAAQLPPAVSAELLRALLPLSAHRAELRDAIVLTLRKASFLRDEGARLGAVHGFLLLLDGAPPALAPALEPGALSSGALDSEVLGFLRRCLAHQPAVRAALYDGLPPVFAARPHLRPAILELLAAQLSRYHERRGEVQPLDLHACIAHSNAPVDGGAAGASTTAGAHAMVATEAEPLALLIRCLASCLLIEGTAPDPAVATSTHARALLEDIRNRMHAVSVADFGLDKTSSFEMASAHGQANVAAARMLQSVLIALVEVEVGCEGDECALGRAISLHGMHTELSALLKGGAGVGGAKANAGGKGGASKGGKAPPVAPSTFGLALSPSLRILRLAVAAAEPATHAIDAPADGLHAPRGEPLLRCAVLSAQRGCDALAGAARTEAACALVPLLLAEAQLAIGRAIALGARAKDVGHGKDKGQDKDKECGKEKEAVVGGGRSYGALVLDALDALFKNTLERPALCALLRVALASGDADVGEGAAGAMRVAASMTSRPSARPRCVADVDAGSDASAEVSTALRTLLEPMLSRLLHEGGAHTAKEAEACLRVVRSLGARLPADAAGAHAAWALAQCREAPAEACNAAAGRALIAHWIQLSARAHGGSVQAALDVLVEARSHVGAIEREEDENEPAALEPMHGFRLMHDANALALAQPAIDQLDDAITEVERALVVLKRVMPAAADLGAAAGGHADATSPHAEAELEVSSVAAVGANASGAGRQPALELQRMALSRVLELEQPLLVLTSCELTPGPSEHALRTVEKLYRALGAAFALAPSVSRQHRLLVEMHWQRLSRNTYALISRLASEAGDGAAVRKRTKREARLVPGVIFRIEQFEGLLVRQSKKLKVDLTSQMRRSTARDFRIQLDRLPEDGDRDGEKENEDTGKKKRKRSSKRPSSARDEAEAEDEADDASRMEDLDGGDGGDDDLGGGGDDDKADGTTD
ncbi:hypothetical protein KFE25_007026 [Diacronema lutheri]|uniref:FANCI solenoid 4 domain-containing protein n=1 Tax=Diacronema lutheri TaxID=2081491 RepID=A0A8J5XX49_DIALT|nr:hypothetical protein KFE25_007026 [Diacronema lutheri]